MRLLKLLVKSPKEDDGFVVELGLKSHSTVTRNFEFLIRDRDILRQRIPWTS